MDRRDYLKVTGGIGVAGLLGASAFTSSAAAATAINITASGVSVSNDRGDVSSVTADPQFTVEWENLDDAVGKVFWLLEAKVGDGDWMPVYRATPWLDGDQMGTTGSVTRFSSASGGLGPLVIADEQGVPDYGAMSFPGGVDLASYMDGTSMSSASNYPNNGVVLQNNFPSENAGYYGAASDTAPLDNDDDAAGSGSTKVTPVTLRYTIELQRPNLSQLGYLYDGEEWWPSEGTDAEQIAAAAENVDALEESDIDAGNSRLVMEGEDGYQSFDSYSDGAGIPYDVLQNNDDHVGIIVTTAQFDVSATNEGSDAGASGDSGTGAS